MNREYGEESLEPPSPYSSSIYSSSSSSRHSSFQQNSASKKSLLKTYVKFDLVMFNG